MIDLIKVTDDRIDQMHFFRQHFTLWPEHLMGMKIPVTLQWQSVQFLPANQDGVSPLRGIYAFVIQHPNTDLPPHGYVAYVGITGNAADRRTLQVRFGEYLRDQQSLDRLAVSRMLRKWRDCLYFHFAEVPDKKIDLSTIEKAVNDALIPPFSTQDFSAEIRQAKNVAEKF
jgi:hypothetical protein